MNCRFEDSIACLPTLSTWMSNSPLKVNRSKTELLNFHVPLYIHTYHLSNLLFWSPRGSGQVAGILFIPFPHPILFYILHSIVNPATHTIKIHPESNGCHSSSTTTLSKPSSFFSRINVMASLSFSQLSHFLLPTFTLPSPLLSTQQAEWSL